MRTISTSAQGFNIGGLRMDASFYASPGVQATQTLQNWKKANKRNRIEALHEVCIPRGYFIPSRFKRVYVRDEKHGARVEIFCKLTHCKELGFCLENTHLIGMS
jgi:hypothetical protein